MSQNKNTLNMDYEKRKKHQALFEDALDETGFGKFNYLMIILCSILVTSMVFESVSVSYIVPAGVCELHTTSAQQGLIAGTPLIGILATSHVWGFYADTKGRRKILIVSLILGLMAGLLATLSPNWIVLCLLKLLSCSAVSGTFALAFTLIGECTPRNKRSFSVMLVTSIFFAASGFMAVLTIPVLALTFSYKIPFLGIYFNSWRLLNLIYALPSGLGIIALLFSYESPKYLLSAGREDEAIEVLRNMFVINQGKKREDYLIESIILEETSSQASTGFWESVKRQTLPLFQPPLRNKTLLLALLFVTVYFCIFPYFLWLPHINDEFMRSVESGATELTFCQMLRSSQHDAVDTPQDCALNNIAMIMVFGIQMLLGTCNMLLSSLISFCGRKKLMIAIQFVTGTVGLCINFSTSWKLTAALFVIFLCCALNFSLLNTFSVDSFPTYVKAMAICITLMTGRVSAVISVNLLKYLLVTNCEISFYLFGGLTIGGGILGFLLPPDKIIEKTQKSAHMLT